MYRFDSGRVRWHVILVQLIILAGLVAFYMLCLPHLKREKAMREPVEREQKIEAFFQKAVVEDTMQEIAGPLKSAIVRRHPQKLRATFTVEEVEAVLGVPDVASTDFRGGQHLTWIGTAHKLQGSFNAGRLYCLAREDRSTGHGVMVFESIGTWHPF
jgi:hypothetical protein